MAQQVFAQWHPVAKALDEENNEVYIPFAGIHAQTRDGKDEVIFGAGAMVWDPNAGMWVPVDAANPLEVRVRELETELQQLRQLLQSGDVKVALTGRLPGFAETPTMLLAGETLEELLTHDDADNGTLTFSKNIEWIEIYNTDSSNDGTFNVNGIDILVPKGEVFKSRVAGTPSNTVTVWGATTYIVGRYS